MKSGQDLESNYCSPSVSLKSSKSFVDLDLENRLKWPRKVAGKFPSFAGKSAGFGHFFLNFLLVNLTRRYFLQHYPILFFSPRVKIGASHKLERDDTAKDKAC